MILPKFIALLAAVQLGLPAICSTAAHAADDKKADKSEQATEVSAVVVAAKRRSVNIPKMPMVVVPAGSFIMGSPNNEPGRRPDEGRQHVVYLKSFEIGKYQVTRGQWKAFVAETGYDTGNQCETGEHGIVQNRSGRNWRFPQESPASDNQPVVCVNWNDAQAYIAWLSKKTGESYRLPTESEYEYAARAGTETPFWWGADIRDACKFANGPDRSFAAVVTWARVALPCDDGFPIQSPVGSFKPNRFGLFDMAGNARVWTADCYADSYAGAPDDGSARTGPGDCKRVLRGGDWGYDPLNLRVAHRNWDFPDSRSNAAGFRLARSLP